MRCFRSTCLMRVGAPSIRFCGSPDREHAGRKRPCLPDDGFSVIELFIAISVLGIVLSMAMPSVRGYLDNYNLKTAARTISGDIAYLREAAMTEYNNGTKYCIRFDIGSNKMSLLYDNSGSMVSVVNYPSERIMSDFGSGIRITSTPNGSQWTKIYQRGFIGNTGDIELTNNRGSRATITLLATGRVYVAYSMQ